MRKLESWKVEPEWNGIYTKNVYLYLAVSCCKNQRKRNIYKKKEKTEKRNKGEKVRQTDERNTGAKGREVEYIYNSKSNSNSRKIENRNFKAV